MNKTRFGKSYLLGKDEYVDGKHRIKNIPLVDMMDGLGFIPDNKNVNEITDLNVVWYEKDDEVLLQRFMTTIVENLIGLILLKIGRIMMTNLQTHFSCGVI